MEELERSTNFRLTESDNGRVGKKPKFQADRVRQWKSWKEAQISGKGLGSASKCYSSPEKCMKAYLTLKAPPIICSRRQLKNFAAFFKNNK